MSTINWLPMRYRDFYDVPRLVAVRYGPTTYLFDSPFDDDSDEYLDEYIVHRLPEDVDARLEEASWAGLTALGEEVGRVPIDDVEFDSTRRECVSESVFRHLGIT